MTVLDMYCSEILKARGISRQHKLRNLRKYLKSTPLADTLSDIIQINNVDYLKVLWEAGLNKWEQEAVERRQLQLKVRRST